MARGIGPERRGRSSARADAGSRRPSTTHLRSRDLATLGPTAPCVPQRPLGVARGSAPTPGLSVRVRGVAVSPPVAAAASTSSRSVQYRATRATPPAACFTSSATAVRPITRGTSVCRLAGSSGACSELPDPNRLEAFDRNRRAMVTMAENVDRATPTQLADLVQQCRHQGAPHTTCQRARCRNAPRATAVGDRARARAGPTSDERPHGPGTVSSATR
jgi:hypothetical protein